ncbi:MAG: SDR family oxidoreductase [Candidatus Margulisiibacteriota bacterium]|jgi:3-oxoacyl-[acyl-carrier protein] reductase
MNNSESKKSKLIVIVGGTGGIGSEMAKLFLLNGEKVCITHYEGLDQAKEVVSQKIASEVNTDKCFLYQADLESDISVDNIFQKIHKDHGNIDVIIFAATALTQPKHFFTKEWQDFNKHINIQIKGLFSVVKNTAEQIKEKHKTKFIILLTEYCIGVPPASLSDYITAKYGLMGLAKSLAVELAGYNCTVNMISPGMTKTSLLSNLPPKLIEITAMKNPLKRIAIPRDVANVALFLASDDSDYLNGVNITVNGGSVMF